MPTKNYITEAHVERMARNMLVVAGGNPDMLVFVGEPQMFGTPQGPVFTQPTTAAVPMWTLYTGSARTALEISQSIVAEAHFIADFMEKFPEKTPENTATEEPKVA